MTDEILPGGQRNLDVLQASATGKASTEAAFDPAFVDRDPGAGQPAGGEGLRWWWERFGEAFSDVEHHLEQTVATPGNVITVSTLTGRHTGEWMGHGPTGRTFRVRNVQVMRFEDGRAVERWGSTDELGMLQQLGLA